MSCEVQILFVAARCPTTNFSCWNGDCLKGSTQCNQIQDCSDNSDEIECCKILSHSKPHVCLFKYNLIYNHY